MLKDEKTRREMHGLVIKRLNVVSVATGIPVKTRWNSRERREKNLENPAIVMLP